MIAFRKIQATTLTMLIMKKNVVCKIEEICHGDFIINLHAKLLVPVTDCQ